MIFFRKRKRKVTLLYHSVGYINPKNDPYRINILPENFERHLKIIFRHRDNIEITFDDGYSNNFKNAFPLLKKNNLVATFFLITDFIDGKIESSDFGGKNFKEHPLTWNEVKIMDKAGIRFGSHSKTHPHLTNVTESQLIRELTDSKRRIEEVLGHQIDSFAYPFGNTDSFNSLIKKVLKEAKYNYAYTNIMGCYAEPKDKFSLRRVRIYREDGPLRLKMKIKGAYDWIEYFT